MNDAYDFILEYMRRHQIPLTREEYIKLAYLGERNNEGLSAEEEAELPEQFRRESDLDWMNTT